MDVKCPGCYKIPMVFGYPTVLSAYRRKSKADRKMLLSRRKQH